ncbi:MULTISPECIES: GntR family transcriptional regulator [unclassified Paracoccus (in: a-proteobacteria)]|uniref:GntR family transcriptional regulator n=1 Tax=unclassified Paracoccus (in: a-proteobacteria) TaxID=2688777 RepID=UPI001E632489|nr:MULTISPECIES: GntR family transcriptional regulator [unclassified Paracoccus (in: a-proteobacteria)]UXU76533.1 GntR family transcriptional regulator [Paracoccus sp. SMMA_5]UXU82400.1 GntR family transcriptional regulator [Paracoccus sp. SMMA_5_TC]
MSDDQMLNTRAQVSLTEALRRGDLRSGQFLSMPQLVQILGYPMAAVREAARHASAAGWLDIIPKRGVQVLEARSETIRDSLDARMVLDQEGARRRIRCDRLHGLDDLRRAHQDILAQLPRRPEAELAAQASAVDLSLHDYLAEGLDNAVLRASYETNRIRIAIIQRVRPFVTERIGSSMQEHLRIIDALERRDLAAALEAISHHSERTQHWWGGTA